MNNKPRNPSAFPAGLTEGMTLRDYFAAKAMVALMDEWTADPAQFESPEEIASSAYEYADAMLAGRERDQ